MRRVTTPENDQVHSHPLDMTKESQLTTKYDGNSDLDPVIPTPNSTFV